MPLMRQPVATPERLAAAATAAFARRGYGGTSTHGIAQQVGLPQGLIRHHFGSKEGLWRAVVEGGISAVLADLEALAGDPTIADWMALAERHLDVVAVLLQALLEGGPRLDYARGAFEPLAQRLRRLHQRVEPLAGAHQSAMWLAAVLAMPLLARGCGERAGLRETREREIDLLFAWLSAPQGSVAGGPFSLQAARAALRGERQ